MILQRLRRKILIPQTHSQRAAQHFITQRAFLPVSGGIKRNFKEPIVGHARITNPVAAHVTLFDSGGATDAFELRAVNLNLIGLAAVLGSLIVFKLVYDRLEKRPVRVRLLAAFVFSIPGAPALLAAVYYLHVLPERSWFYEFRSLPGFECFSLFLGAAAGAFVTLLPRLSLPFALAGLLTVTAVPYLKPILAPLPADALSSKWENDVCLQSTASTCGPASVATILHKFGLNVSEQEVATQAHTYAGGTEAWYLARFVRAKGMKAKFDFRPGMPEDLVFPAMVGIRLGSAGHFIAVLERDGDMLTVADPLSGKEIVTLEKLRKRCELTGFHLSISR